MEPQACVYVLVGYKVEEWNIEIESSRNGRDGAMGKCNVIGSLSQPSQALQSRVQSTPKEEDEPWQLGK